ncbi:MAG TPA: Calx-beta domain-containing protein [Chitinispirillaceae bacterium]|nr:Calx-beta domain-containing protein [Chitinispirillaceae bacterium]
MKKIKNILKMVFCGALISSGITSTLPQSVRADESAPKPSRWMSLDGSSKPVHSIPSTGNELLKIVPVMRSNIKSPSSKNLIAPGPGERICLIVEDAIYSSIATGLARFAADLEAEGYTVIINRFGSGTAEELRYYLATLYAEPQSLVGAELIGDIPYIIYEMMQDWDGTGGDPEEYEDFPCDIFYMDLNGTWSDQLTNGSVQPDNGKYDTWTGDRNLEIWVSRMKTSNLSSLGTETAILNNYFIKNHSYRQRTLNPSSTALIYDDDDWTNMCNGDSTAVAKVYTSWGITAVKDADITTAADYKSRLPASVELILTRSHGNPSGHGYYQDGRSIFNYVYPNDYRSKRAPALFCGYFVCSGSDFTASNYLAGSIAFDTSRTTGLLAWGSTKTGGMWNDNYFYTPISQGNCFGKAFTTWFNSVKDNSVAPEWWYGMVLIGDGSLRTSPKTFALSLCLPDNAVEGDGVIDSQATVSLPWPLDYDFKVFLESSDIGEVTVPESLIIKAGDKTTQFPLTIVDDFVSDGLQRVKVTASAPYWADGCDSMTISDRGQTIHFSSAVSNASEGQGTAVITLSLSTPSTSTLQADYSIAGGTAKAGGIDAALASGTITFKTGDLTKSIIVTITDDLIDEPDETVRIALVNKSGGFTDDTLFHTLTIVDNDTPPQVNFVYAALSENEKKSDVSISVTLSEVSECTVSVDYAATAITALGAGTDFTLSDGTLKIFPGETSKSINFRLVNDNVDEIDESFEITLSNPVNVTTGTKIVHRFTIIDDDFQYVSFNPVEAQGPESLSTVGIDVMLSAKSKKSLSIDYRVLGGTASGSGVDYTLTNGTLLFSPGDTLKTITLAVTNDGCPEEDESVRLILKNPVNVLMNNDTIFTYGILNDDLAPVITSANIDTAFEDIAFTYKATVTDPSDTPLIYFDQIPSWLDTASEVITGTPTEGVGDTSFRVIAYDGFLADTMIVYLRVTPVNDTPRIITNPITATAESIQYKYDLNAFDPDAGDILTYALKVSPSGMTIDAETGEILWFPDSDDIGDTTITVAVTDRAGAVCIQTYQLTIKDIDDYYLVSFKTAEAKGAESLSTIGINVVLNAISTKSISIGYRVVGGTASGNGVDYTLTNGTFLFNSGDTLKTITLAVINDGRPEEDETIDLILENPVNVIMSNDSVFTYTIINDDFAPVITSDSIDTAFEDVAFTYKISVSDPGDTPAIYFDNIPSWLDTASGMITGTPIEGTGETLFTIIAYDGFSSDTMIVHLKVFAVNDTPRIISEPVTSAAENVQYRYSLIGFDPDAGDTMTYALKVFPSGMTINSLTGEILWSPDSSDIGDTIVTVAVTDRAGAVCIQTFKLTVKNTNDPPVFVSTEQDTISQDSHFVYQAVALDPDGTKPFYRFVNLPSWLSCGADSIFGTPRRGNRDTVVQIIADDGELEDTLNLRIIVISPSNESPSCSLFTVASAQSDSITIRYLLDDPDSDLLRIELFYELELNGQWIKSDNLSGNTASIGPSAYSGSIIWHSHKDIRDRKIDFVRVKIIPYDADSGNAGISNSFIIDNRALFTVTGTPAGIIAPDDKKGITVTFSSPIDPKTVENSVTITGSKSGSVSFMSTVSGNTLNLRMTSLIIAAETLTISLNPQLQSTNGVALQNYSFEKTVAFMGDFNLDGEVGIADLVYLSEYWYRSATGNNRGDSIVEIGPVKGSVPYLTVSSDGVFDFEDIDVFVHMWHWYHDNVSKSGALAKRAGDGFNASVQKAGLQWEMVNGKPQLSLALDVVNVSRLVACSYSVFYDTATITQVGIDTATMLKKNNGQAIIMKTNDKGMSNLDMVRLSSITRDVSGSGRLTGFNFAKKSRTARGSIKVCYDLIDSDHKSIESGIIELEIPAFDNETALSEAGKLTIAPNPSFSASSSRRFEFKNDPSALNLVSSNNGGFIFIFGIPNLAGKKGIGKLSELEGYIKIYDVMGTVVAYTSRSTLYSNDKNEQFSIYWDGRSSSGKVLSPGVYRAVLFYKSAAGSGKLTGNVGMKR